MHPLAWFRRKGTARRAAASDALNHFLAYWLHHGAYVVVVTTVQQHAQRGTKAYVQRVESPGVYRDAWFWHTNVRAGDVLAVRSSSGWGPHTGRYDVLYVGTEHGHDDDVAVRAAITGTVCAPIS